MRKQLQQVYRRYPYVIEYNFKGIPCLIGVTHFLTKKPHSGSPLSCDSDMDFYGYTEIEFELLDREGYKADWLEKKLSKEDTDIIEEFIYDYLMDS